MANQLSQFKLTNFKPLWKKLKPQMTCQCYDLFYIVVNIDDTIGRAVKRESTSNGYRHWFGLKLCHWNVVLAAFVLNNENFSGDYKIISNRLHSAIINLKTKELICPTLNEIEANLKFFKNGFKVYNLINHLPTVIEDMNRTEDFLERYPKHMTHPI